MDADAKYLKSLSVLYVEDDYDAREQLSQFLRRRTGELIHAKNGESGLKAFRASHPRMVVTDILMPRMDGLEMARKIRQEDPHIPILVTTAFEQTDYLLRSIEIGVDRYVLKPVNTRLLHTALLECARRLRLEEEQLHLSEQLSQARKMEALGILAGGMAHDFNNLLQIVLTSVNLAKLDLEPGTALYDTLGQAEEASLQASKLGNLLVTCARGPSDAVAATPLGPILEDVVTAHLKGTNVNHELDLPTTLACVRANRDQLELVFANLTRNAVEAMPNGGTLRVTVQVVSAGGQGRGSLAAGEYAQVTFQDSGHGITPTVLPRIFDAYFSTKDRGSQKGTGLGLSVCHSIIRGLGGLIWAESRPAEGAAFHLYLPVAES